MDVSILLARIFGLVYVTVGLGILLNRTYYQKLFNDWWQNYAALYLGGFMALVAGLVIVTYHNIWVASWVVLVTVIGWLALIKGILLLVFPSAMLRFTQMLVSKPRFLPIEGIVALVIGLFLSYHGFF